jgi:hypothetical protein
VEAGITVTDRFVELLFAALAGVIGAAVTYWFGVRKQLQEIRGEYDQELRTARRTAYLELWKAFEPLAVYAPETAITYQGMVTLGVGLRSWYFKEGGGLLSTERARDAYFLVQDAIDRVAQVADPATVLRPATRHWTRTDLDKARERLRLQPLATPDETADARATWHGRTAATIGAWPFGAPPDDDFVLLQFLASSLRTLLAQDLHARDRSILEPA